MSENSKSRKRENVNSGLTSAIPCSECKYAIYQAHDVFTGKPRWFCGNEIVITVPPCNDMELACDINIGGCEFGERMSDIRWTDKVYLDSLGNIRTIDGCPTNQMSQDLINKLISNVGLVREYKENKE